VSGTDTGYPCLWLGNHTSYWIRCLRIAPPEGAARGAVGVSNRLTSALIVNATLDLHAASHQGVLPGKQGVLDPQSSLMDDHVASSASLAAFESPYLKRQLVLWCAILRSGARSL